MATSRPTSELTCNSCNRGLWRTSKIRVTVSRDQIIELNSVSAMECLLCGRSVLLEVVDGRPTVYPLRSLMTQQAIARATDAEWFSKFEAK